MNFSKGFHRAVLDRGDAAVLVIDGDDLAVKWASRPARRLFRRARGAFPDLVATEDAAKVGAFLQAAASGEKVGSRCTCSVPVRGSVPRRIDLIARNLSGDPDVGGILVVALDVTGWAERTNRLLHELSIDAKTGLANWNSFVAQLQQAIRGAPASGPGPVVLFLDLDHFKLINDRYGHQVGDEVLRRTASRIATAIEGRGTAARMGGEEFGILLDRASEPEAVATAEEILAVIRTSITLPQGDVVRITASAGITFVRPGRTPGALLRQADLAMYRAKTAGRDNIKAYNENLEDWILAKKLEVEQLAELVEQLAEAASTDSRTGLPNYSLFDADHARQNDSGEPYSLLLIDLDHFHSYNEMYGYLEGNETLRRVGDAIKRMVREGDRTYRYGGEEFTVLLPGAALADAVAIGERIRLAVQSMGIEHRGNAGGIVTVCVGAAEAGPDATVAEAVRVAGRASFEAKAAGRNRVIGKRIGSS